MRARQKLTAVGAFALATAAVVGGAVVTSHAMAESPTPGKGTMTVVAMTAGSDGAIKCVYNDVDLPTPSTAEVGTKSVGPVQGHTETISVNSDTGPVDATGAPVAGAVIMSADSVTPADGKAPDNPTIFAVNGSTGAGDPALPPLPAGAVVLNAADAKPGTAEECAALKPTSTGLPPLPTSP
jgi:hypothetical protein